jgi:hypothetical protein
VKTCVSKRQSVGRRFLGWYDVQGRYLNVVLYEYGILLQTHYSICINEAMRVEVCIGTLRAKIYK